MSAATAVGQILKADNEGISKAAEEIRNGGLVAFPTETVYGLGADATNDKAVAAIFAAKNRPEFNPLIVHFSHVATVEFETEFNETAKRLVDVFWPGALTLVLPRRKDTTLSLLVSAGLETVAVRVPDHPVAQALLTEANRPIAAPSANRSGFISPTRPEHVAISLPSPENGGPRYILDGGACRVGLESTVVDLSGPAPVLLRPGGIPAEDIEKVIGPLKTASESGGGEAQKSPGMLSRHYAPKTPLRLNAETAASGEALLGFGPAENATLNLSLVGDLPEAAANLFAMLRELDEQGYERIAVMPIPETGLGRAINDRLRRAAMPPEEQG